MIVLERPKQARLFFVLRGSILPRIAAALATCVGLAVAVTLTHGFLFRWKLTLTPVPFTLIGLALAIFLGFRNNAAYDRYWEARKLWGDLVHRSRSFARQLQGLMNFDAPARFDDAGDVRIVLIRRTIAFAHALRQQLRGEAARADASPWLSAGEFSAFTASRSGTNWLLMRMGETLGAEVRGGRLDARLAAEMDQTLSAMSAVAAGCERIRNTPIPFAYTLLLHRTASLYCFLLPFGLVDLISYATPLVVGIVAYTFFGLDAVGDEIEDPFGLGLHHLPLNALCRTIEIDLLEAMGASDLPLPLQPVDSVLN